MLTGFMGTPYICFALSDFGHEEEACRLLLKDDFPSWLYQVKKRRNNSMGTLGWH